MNTSPYRRPEKVLIYLYRRTANRGVEYLLLRREPSGNAGSIWQTVVGSVRWNEELVEAARREIFEETGLTRLKGIMAFGYVFSFPFRLPPGHQSDYAPDVTAIRNTVFAAEVASSRPVHLSEEHVGYAWFSYQEALDRVHWSEEKEALSLLHPMLGGTRAAMRTG
jgi:8-oxo-dGTP pyrophosphatase MutT (NUDIX family)